MPNFTPATEEQLNPKKRELLTSDEKFNKLTKAEPKTRKYEHHYRVIECSIISKNGDYRQVIILYNGFGKSIASMYKTFIFGLDDDLNQIKEWDYVTDIREMRRIALEHYFMRIKKRSKDGFMFD